MPKTCDEVRVFVNTSKLLSGDVGKALDSLKGTMLSGMAGKPDAEKMKKVEDDLTAAGLTTSSIKELSICAAKGHKGLAAASIDFKGDLAATLVKTIETATGKAPEKKEEDGWTLITGDKDSFIAIKGGVVLQGPNMDDLKAATKGGDGASEFADASSYVLWIKGDKDGQDFVGTLKDAGSDYQGKVSMPPPKEFAADFKKDPQEGLKKLQAELDKGTAELEKNPTLKMAEPVLKNAKLAMDGDKVVITTSFPQSLVGDIATAVAKDPKGIFGMMR